MTEATAVASRPVWVDLASPDPAASRAYYSNLFGWDIQVAPEPQYGGYGIATLDGASVAGIGPKPMPETPTAWSVYIGAEDLDQVAARVDAAGGTVHAQPFDVGGQGRMAVFQDPSGAFICGWQPRAMRPFRSGVPNTFGWAELDARGLAEAVPFYRSVFGWTAKESPMGEGAPPYTEFQLDGQSIAGGMEMMPMVPAEVPSFWMVYFMVADVDGSFARAVESGGRELVAPMDFPGGRFAILTDPQGATFGLLRM